ncbi:MAG: MBL fold metallo-hydrolase [Coriobacteriia bacterium]|nr:MBL fold metallo-hydrolase [Coriobacteriia bacterium]
MRFKFEEGFVEGVPGSDDRRIIDSYALPDQSVPAKPRLSSTVLLVRDADRAQPAYRIGGTDPDGRQAPAALPADFPKDQAVEVFMLRRAKTMAFAADAIVFPGGSVDERDANPELPWFGPCPAEWAELMGCNEEDARLAIVAAAREVFEESGVLLAGPDGGTLVQVATDESREAPLGFLGADVWQSARESLAKHETSFAEFLIVHQLMLRTDLLGLIFNLQTPADEPRRYDTYFFSALMPEGQQADGNTSEAQIADWVTPARAVAESDAGHWRVMPPTLMNLTKLAEAQDAASFVQTRRKVSKCTLHVEYLDETLEHPVLRWRVSDVLRGCRSDFDESGTYVPPRGFVQDVEPWQGGWVHSRMYCHLCKNPNPMTYTGTNTWIVLGPSPELPLEDSFGKAARLTRSCMVVDPGVEAEAPEIYEWCVSRNLAIGAVVTTHHHADHTAGAQALADLAQCPWMSWERGNLGEGQYVPGETPGWPEGMSNMEVIHVPGHSKDSVALVIGATMHSLTGDVLFSQGPTVLKGEEANLADYFKTLDKLKALVEDEKAETFLSGHGYPITDPCRIIDASREHRIARLESIKRALAQGVEPTPEAIVDSVYGGIDSGLRDAALKSAAFQLDYLSHLGL